MNQPTKCYLTETYRNQMGSDNCYQTHLLISVHSKYSNMDSYVSSWVRLKISDPATDPPNASQQAAARWMCTSRTGAKDHARSKLGPTTEQPEVLYPFNMFQQILENMN